MPDEFSFLFYTLSNYWKDYFFKLKMVFQYFTVIYTSASA